FRSLCRTEHMFLGPERVHAVQQMIFAETDEEEQAAYDALLPLQKGDFVGIFHAMDGLPVTVRLLDPPLHEFLPNLTELAVDVAVGKERGEDVSKMEVILAKVRQLAEMNPMLGLRGVRLGILKPGLYAMQVRAIAEAACEVRKAGGDPKVEIMIPLVATTAELQQMRAGRGARGARQPGGRGLFVFGNKRPDADGVRVQPRRHRQVRRDVRGAEA